MKPLLKITFNLKYLLNLKFLRSFFQLVGDLGELRDKDYSDQETRPRERNSGEVLAQQSQECVDIELDHLEVVATLGIGGFGRVELVKVSDSLALYSHFIQRWILIK